jgi:hypothetical protein
MSSGPSPITRLKKLAAEIPEDNVTRALLQQLETHDSPLSDYAIALIGSSILEKALEIAILSRFTAISNDERKRIFDYTHDGALTSLADRTKIAYALGVFGRRTRDDIEHVRTIRNAFAHAVRRIGFDTAEVAEVCGLLHTPGTVTIAESNADERTPRGRYIETTVTLTARLKSSLVDPANVTKRRPLNRHAFLQARKRLLA